MRKLVIHGLVALFLCMAARDVIAGIDIGEFILFYRGDANNDGSVAISDATHIGNYLFSGGPAPTCMDAADANDSGSVTLADMTYITSWLFSGGPAPPSPGPTTCGTDPTSDSLTCVDHACP